jgi:formyltetrahydrofolate deformylase
MGGMNVLRLQCVDQPGIVAAVATALSNNQCNIEESSQYFDHFSGQFFMRVVFTALQPASLKNFETDFSGISQRFAMNWQICDLTTPIRTLLMVSKTDHCLHHLLYLWRTKTLNIDIAGIVSNHQDLAPLAAAHNLPYHYLPITPETKPAQEKLVQQLIDEKGCELILLARYMQVLSQQMCSKNQGKIINIHHSFLPGFKGAKPYHQAHERGVKLIGATAHFATVDLDEGPIIAQNVEAVDHSFTPEKMQQFGRGIEARVLAKAATLFSERRIFLHGHRTVIL